MNKLFPLFALIFLFVACNSDVSKPSPISAEATKNSILFTDLFQPQDGGIFRGVEFDMLKAEVLKIEKTRKSASILKDDSETKLVITTDMGSEVLNFADITYTFDEKGLYTLKVETYAVDKSTADLVYEEILTYLESLYGKGVLAEDGFVDFKSEEKGVAVAVQNIDLETSFGMYIYFDML
jgi:hypothetical protein